MQDSSAGANAKQQIVDRIKQSTNILVTVNSNPSVDALSALLAFSLMLNKMDKHATSVFSGVVPPAINFLEPAKSFENNVDSLRDFIIALDKEKADRLRYKVENDVVKIFITPYKTTITQNDLQFSQGDFNVDLIIALGVEKREELDNAIVAHGRILHDAAVMTINAANQKSSLGSVDWQDSNASSLCEMIAGIGDSLQPNLLDQQLSTALLTGIVAATERFSNQHTTPNVMTIAAKLMAAGANQQLIATNLAAQTQVATVKKGQAVELPADVSAKVGAQKTPNGEMHIKHEEQQKPEVAPQATSEAKPQQQEVTEPEIPIAPPAAASFDELKQAISEDTKQQNVVAEPEPVSDKETINASQPARKEVKPPKREGESYITSKPSWMGRNIQPPTLGGTLSATAQEALENKMRDEADVRNRTLLSHDEQLNAQAQPEVAQTAPQEPKVETQPQENIQPAPVSEPIQPEVQVPAVGQVAQSQPAPVMDSVTLQTEPSLEELEAQAKTHAAEIAQKPAELDAAREAVDAALAAAPPQPNEASQSLGAQEFPQVAQAAQPTIPEPTMADAKQLDNQISGLTLPPLQPIDQSPETAQPQQSVPAMPAQQSDLPPLPPLPPMPDFSTLPPAPVVDQMPQLMPEPQAVQPQPTVVEPEVQMPTPEPISAPTPAPVSNDPAQYRIPGA